jgi:hypothetical protein
VFHGQSTPYVEPRGELSSFYDEHSRVVHVHDPVRTIFDTSDAMPAACGSFSDNAGALSVLQASRIFHNRVVIAATDVRKSSEPDDANGVFQELGDASMLSNGNIMFSRKVGASEITPEKKIIWNYDAPKVCEIHTTRPIGTERVMIIERRPGETDGDP